MPESLFKHLLGLLHVGKRGILPCHDDLRLAQVHPDDDQERGDHYDDLFQIHASFPNVKGYLIPTHFLRLFDNNPCRATQTVSNLCRIVSWVNTFVYDIGPRVIIWQSTLVSIQDSPRIRRGST